MSNRELHESNPVQRDLGSETDEDLARILVATRDEAACAELFDRYRKRIYLWCFRYTHDVEEAVDCTQEIFVRIFNNIGAFRGGARLSTWIYRIARNHCLSLLAQRRRQWHERLRPLGEEDIPDAASESQLRQLEVAHGLHRILQAAQRRMEPLELEAYVLHYREGMTVKEITKVLGCENLTGARTLIQNARRKFQRLVARKEFGDG
jgi:RNA polymerase sigma-70 factor (ECF subfamily)